MHTKFPSSTTPPLTPPAAGDPAAPAAPNAPVAAPKASAPPAVGATDGVDAPLPSAPGAVAGAAPVAKASVPGIPESFPIDALSKVDGKGVSGTTFMLDGGSLRGLKLQVRRVVDGDQPGFEIAFQVTEDKLKGLLERMKTKEAKTGAVVFRGVQVQENGISKYTDAKGTIGSGSSHSPPDLDGSSGSWSLSVEDPKGAKIEVVHDKAALAIRGLTRIHLRGDDKKCTEQLQSVLKTVGLSQIFAPPTPKTKEINMLMRALWQADQAAARSLSEGDLDKLKPADLRAALESAGYTPERIDGLHYEEVFPGHFTVVDPAQAQVMVETGARYLYSTVTDPAHVASILEGGQKSSVQRYKDGLIIDGMSTNADFVTGGATGVFTRLVTQGAIYGENGWAGRTYKLLQNHRQLARTDWYGWDGDFYGRRWQLDTPVNFGPELVRRIDAGGGYKAYNEFIFTAGNRPENIDRVVATNEGDRKKLIEHLAAKGYKPHNGLSLEEFVVMSPKLMLFGPSPFKDIGDPAAFAATALEKATKGENAQLQWFLYEGPSGPPRADLEQKILTGAAGEPLNVLLKSARLRGTFAMTAPQLDAVLTTLTSGTPEQQAVRDRLVNESAEALFRSGADQAVALLDSKKPAPSAYSYSAPFGLTDESYVRIYMDLAAKQPAGAPRSKALQLALDMRAEYLLTNNNVGFKAFLEKYPQVTPEDPKAWLAEKLAAIKEGGAGKADVAMYLAQLTDKAKIGGAQRALMASDSPAALELLKGTITTHGRVFIRGDVLAKALGELPESSQTRQYLLGSTPAALLKSADAAVLGMLEKYHQSSYSKDFGIYGGEWWKVIETQLERTKGEVTETVKRSMEIGGANLVQQAEFKKLLPTLEKLYEVADPAAFAQQAVGELAAPNPGYLKLSWMILGPQAATLRAPALAAILGASDYNAQYVLGYVKGDDGKFPASGAELKTLVAALADPANTQPLQKLVNAAGKELLLAADGDTLDKLTATLGKSSGNLLNTMGLYGQAVAALLTELGEGASTAPVRKFVLENAAPMLASNDANLIEYLKSKSLDYQALGKDAAWAAETVKTACDSLSYYWTSDYYKSYPDYNKIPDGANYILKGASGKYDEAVLAEMEKSIKGWGWSQAVFDRFLEIASDLPDAWKAKLTAAYKGS